MAIKINSGYSVQAPVVIDDRQLLTKAQMKAVNDNIMPSKYFAICADDGLLYCYDKTNEKVDDSGKFRPADAQRKVLLKPWEEYPDTAIQNLSSSLKYGFFYRNVNIESDDVDYYTPVDPTQKINIGAKEVTLSDLVFIGCVADDADAVIALKFAKIPTTADAQWDVTDVMNGTVKEYETANEAIVKYTIKAEDASGNFVLDLEDIDGNAVTITSASRAMGQYMPNYGYWRNFKVQDGIEGEYNRVFQYAVMPSTEDFIDEFETEEEALTWAVQYVGQSAAFRNGYWYQASGAAPKRFALYTGTVGGTAGTFVGIQVDQLGKPIENGKYITWTYTDAAGDSQKVTISALSTYGEGASFNSFKKFIEKSAATATEAAYGGTPSFDATTTSLTIDAAAVTLNKAFVMGTAYPYLTENGTEEGWVNINVQDDNTGDVHRYAVMPAASLNRKGDVVQFIGESSATYTRGFFYECKEHVDSEGNISYAWEEVCTERDMVGRYVVMPYPSETFANDIVQYIGLGDAPYERGLFYECVNVNERVFFCIDGLEDGKFSVLEPQANKAYIWTGIGNFTPATYDFKKYFASDFTDCDTASFTEFDSIEYIESGWDSTADAPYFLIHAIKDEDSDPTTEPVAVEKKCYIYDIKASTASDPADGVSASAAWVTSEEAQWNVTLTAPIYRWKSVQVSECEKLQFKKYEEPSMYEGRVLQYIGTDDATHNLKYGRFYTGINETINCRVYNTGSAGLLVPKTIVANGEFVSFKGAASSVPTTTVIEPNMYNTGLVFLGYCTGTTSPVVYCDAPTDFNETHYIAYRQGENDQVYVATSYNENSVIKEASYSTGWYWKQVHTEDVDSISYSSEDTRINLDNLQDLKKSDLANMSFADYMTILQRCDANTEIEFADGIHEGLYTVFEAAADSAACVINCTKVIAPNPTSTNVKYVWQTSTNGTTFTDVGTESATSPTTYSVALSSTLNQYKLPSNAIYVRIKTVDYSKTGDAATQFSNALKVQAVFPIWVGDASIADGITGVGGVATFTVKNDATGKYDTIEPADMLAALNDEGHIHTIEVPASGSGIVISDSFTPDNQCSFIAIPASMYGYPAGLSKIVDGSGLDFTDSFVIQHKIASNEEVSAMTIGVKLFSDVDFVIDYTILRTEYPATLEADDSYDYSFEF